MRLHGGTVEAASAVDQGTSFFVKLRTGKAHLPGDRVVSRRTDEPPSVAPLFLEEALRWLPDAPSAENLPAGQVPRREHVSGSGIPVSTLRPRLLVADDNADMREYLCRTLSPKFDVLAVRDGLSAWRECVRPARSPSSKASRCR